MSDKSEYLIDMAIENAAAKELGLRLRENGMRTIPLEQNLFQNKDNSKAIFLSTMSFENFTVLNYRYETMVFDGSVYQSASTGITSLIEQNYQWRYNDKDIALATHKKIATKIKAFLNDKISETYFINYLDKIRR